MDESCHWKLHACPKALCVQVLVVKNEYVWWVHFEFYAKTKGHVGHNSRSMDGIKNHAIGSNILRVCSV